MIDPKILLVEKINDQFDLIVSNPPYLKWSEQASIGASVLKHEPHHALFADNDGLATYQIIEKNLDQYLKPNGIILLKINPLNYQWFLTHNYLLIKDINQKYRFAYKQNF